MDRRAFLSTLAGGLFTAPLAAVTQQRDKVARIGYLSGGSAGSEHDLSAAFQQGMRDLGYVEGHFVIEARFAAGQRDRLPELAAELVQRRVDVVLLAATALSEANRGLATLPTVFVIADDPVKAGLVANLARPGGHLTGLTSLNIELDAKRLEILKAALPSVRRVAVLTTPQDRAQRERLATAERAASFLDLQLEILQVSSGDQLGRAIDDAANHRRVSALVVLGSPLLRGYSAQAARLVAKARLAAVSAWREFPEAGGLLSYG